MQHPHTFYFYDLETSGLNCRTDRIMQFAGQRTDADFQPIGEPHNILVQLSDDTLPSPYAIMVTGITPQSTLLDGVTEREFCQFFTEEIATPNTTIMGYNSVRFDDEFIRHTLWRNFYDPYEWQWQDGRSRWDLLDVVRLTRALRPEGINWPVTEDGHSTNRLELLTKLNHISHEHAHDALADVVALIEVTKLIKAKQPQLFNFLYNLREKRAVAQLVNCEQPKPFVYASGRYPGEFEKTTVAYPLAPAENGAVWVFDLRHNLDALLTGEAKARESGTFDPNKPWRERDPWERNYFPIVKKLQYNRCPAVAPLGVLDKITAEIESPTQPPAEPKASNQKTNKTDTPKTGWQKIQLDKAAVETNLQSLLQHPEFVQRVITDNQREFPPAVDPESALYDGFVEDHDRILCSAVRNNTADELMNFRPKFTDERLPELLLHYKAKNFPSTLDEDEANQWEAYRTQRLTKQSEGFLRDIAAIQKSLTRDETFGDKSPEDCAFLVEELLLWYESLSPSDY